MDSALPKNMTTARTESETRRPPVRPARLDNPAGDVYTLSFALGRQPIVRAILKGMDAVLTRTLYRPFMRFLPPVVREVALAIPALPPALHGLTMVQMTDFHHSQTVPLHVIEQAVAVANKQRPQAVFLTGDFVSNDASYAAACARVLGDLRAPLGVYAVIGNHDYWTDPHEVARQLTAHGITVLTNQARRLTGDLWVAGIDDAWSGRPDLDRALAAVPAGATTILLAHEPDFADEAQGRGIAVQLSGHSHGGQVRVPFTRRPVVPFLAWKYYTGIQRVGDMLVYTSGGLGTMQPPFLFTCRPEVAVLRLTQ
jgi:hypothetical protein